MGLSDYGKQTDNRAASLASQLIGERGYNKSCPVIEQLNTFIPELHMSRSILLIGDDPAVIDVAGQLRVSGWDVHVEEPVADSLSEVTRRHVSRVLERNKGNRQRTAKALGVTRATLYKWLKDWGMERFGR